MLDSSAIIALSQLGYLDRLRGIFSEAMVPRAVYEEICFRGRGLVGERELSEAIEAGLISVRDVRNRVLVNALLDPLGLGEAETIALALEESADYAVLDDKLARRRARAMGLNVIGTLRVLRLMYDSKVIDKEGLIKALEELRILGFRVTDETINKVLRYI